MRENYLFCTKGHLDEFLGQCKLGIKEEIYRLTEEYLLNVSEEDLVTSLIEKNKLDPPILKLDEKGQLDPKEIDVDVSKDPLRSIIDRSRPVHIKGTLYTVIIPFEGDEELFYYRPSSFFYSVFPQGVISGSELCLEYITTEHNPETLKTNIEQDIQLIKSYSDFVKGNMDGFNNSLENYIRDLVKTRKEKLFKDRNLASALDIPIRKRSNISLTYSIPVKPKRIRIELPQAKLDQFKQDPTLAMEIYEDVLNIIQNMALVIERSPSAFSKMREENLRDHFLVQLNGQYEGQAMGEVFNYQGKTDILIRYEKANAFIAECKFWDGEKKLLETIDQLLKYITWRDTKTAILLFNRGGNLTEILSKIPEIIKKHSCYKRQLEISGETRFRYVLKHPDDPNREFLLTIMVFNMPKV